MTFPFLFYGAQPAEWYGGGRLDYELGFASAPTTGERVAVATAVRACLPGLREIRLDAHDRWHWAGPWAALVVRTKTSDTDWNVFFDEVAALFRAVHAACPIDLAICRSVDTRTSEPDDPWTAWSLSARPLIGRRPRWTSAGRIGGDRFADRELPLAVEASFDAAFEAARA